MRISFLLLLLTICPSLLFPQASIAPKMNALFNKWQIVGKPGAAVGIIHQGKILFAKGYGLANLEHQVPFTAETVSDIGSVSKQITNFGIVLLVQKGKLSLDDPISKFFPDLPEFSDKISVRHLIHHTSGIREIYGALGITGVRSGDGIFSGNGFASCSPFQGAQF